MYRKTTIDGFFYPKDPNELNGFIAKNISKSKPVHATSVIAPHAGYIYSGALAVQTLSSVKIPSTVVMLCPNHTGCGAKVAVYPSGAWQTPIGDVQVNQEIVNQLVVTGAFKPDIVAHAREHSIEVLLPILKYLKTDVKIVPVCLMGQEYDELEALASVLLPIVTQNNLLLLASTDMNHYENVELTLLKDRNALERIQNLNPQSLFSLVSQGGISMCGVGPVVVAMLVSMAQGASKATLIGHTNSGVVSGNNNDVVSYAGIYIS